VPTMEVATMREEWVDAYETVEREHPDATDEELIELTEELVADRMAAKADDLRDRAKEANR